MGTRRPRGDDPGDMEDAAPLSRQDDPRRAEPALVFAVALALLGAFAGVRDLWDADEGRYAAVALDMLRSGDFVTPRLAGMRFVDKPPLLYWMEDASFAVFGRTPFAARLPCLLAGAACCALIFALALRWAGDRRAAWLAALTAATSLAVMALSRTVTTDMCLCACVVGALVAGHAALSSRRVGPRAGLGLAVGLGLLAKGPLAAALPLVVAVSWVVVGVDARRVLRAVLSPVAWATALAVSAPWYVLMERANPGYLAHFLGYEHLRRFSEAGAKESHPVWLYAALLPVALLPWTPLLWRARLPRALEVGRRGPVPAQRLAWAWCASVLLFLTASATRLATYVLPALPPLFVLVGARLSGLLRDPAAAGGVGWWALAAGVLAALAGGALALDVVDLRKTVAQGRLAALGLPVAASAVGALAVPVAFLVVRSAAARGAVLVLAAAALGWGIDLALARLDDLRSSRALAAFLAREAGPSDAVVVLDRYPQGLRFYADVDARIAENPRPGRARVQREIVEPWATRDGAGRLLTMADLRALWGGASRVLLVAREVDAAAEFPTGRVLARNLAGAQRSDLVVVESRARTR